jgi:Bacterial Ig-like domain (group 3)
LSYSVDPGIVLPAGVGQTLSVSFTPSDPTDYSTASASVTIDVDKAAPAISWPDPADIIYGTGLSSTQLDATASWIVAGVEQTVAGTFTYTPAPGTILHAGSNQTLSVTFTPSDPTDYSTASTSVTIDVAKAAPSISWADPAGITYGTALTTSQLDATASVPGSFAYSPSPGTLLGAGGGQTLSVMFTPSDTTDYSTATASATIDVAKASPALSLDDPGGVFDGNAYPASLTIAGPGPDDSPAASLEDVTPTLTYYDGTGTSGTSLGSTPPTAAGTYTVVAAFPGTADYSPIQSAPVTFTISPATATIALTASAGSAVYGQSVTLAVTVTTAAGTAGGSILFLDGTTPLATIPLDGAGTATLTVSALAVGTHSIVATYSGNSDDIGAQSGSVPVTVSRAATEIVLVPQPVFRRKKVVSIGLRAAIRPLTPGGGLPTGQVTFEVRSKGKRITEKVLGTAMLGGGVAVLTVKSSKALKQPITILYGGDADFSSSQATTTVRAL